MGTLLSGPVLNDPHLRKQEKAHKDLIIACKVCSVQAYSYALLRRFVTFLIEKKSVFKLRKLHDKAAGEEGGGTGACWEHGLRILSAVQMIQPQHAFVSNIF